MFNQLSRTVMDLDRALDRIRVLAESCGVPSPEHEDWYALLKHKLIPQLNDTAFMIVAVTGGTNTGKSLIFNHLAGEHFSAVDHRASGTKHPVCLVPTIDGPVSYETILGRHFDTFKLIAWHDARQALQASETHHLFWAQGKHLPKRLLLLDTPDVDSDCQVNWHRARAIRHSTDILIAVLTNQKYNDAAVRRYFREAGEADKPILVIFNMFDPEKDLEFLPHYLDQFREETGTDPIAVFVAPYDKENAQSLALVFTEFVRDPDGQTYLAEQPVNLAAFMTDLHFDTIKSQTLLGALKVLNDPVTGVKAYLKTVENTSKRFEEALQTLRHISGTQIEWPGMPTPLLVEEIRHWWNQGRPNWSRNINSTYRRLGSGLLWPLKKASDFISTRYLGTAAADAQDPLEDFRTNEKAAVLSFIERVIEKLEGLAGTDNPVLRREMLELISGERRAALLKRAYEVLDTMDPVDDTFRTNIQSRLSDWSERNANTLGWFRSIDHLTTLARPIITVTFAAGGFALGAQVIGNLAGEAALAGTVAAGGEAVLHAGSETVSQGLAKLFRSIQEDFVIARSKRFYDEFQKELWSDVMERLQRGAAITQSESFQQCANWSAAAQD